MQMSKLQDVHNFQVAILIENISQAKDISDSLRELGIYAFFYQDLEQFWVDANTQTPDFLIIDVKKMSQGKLLFKDHPKVINGSLAYSFYYSETTRPILSSTYGLSHYGYIKKEIQLKGQIQSILRRRNENLHLVEQNNSMSERLKNLQRHTDSISKEAQQSIRFENHYFKMKELVASLSEIDNSEKFEAKVAHIFTRWESCISFSVYKISENGQKLISPKLSSPKYKEQPALWLSRTNHFGMEKYAIDMATEVALDSLSTRIKVLGVCAEESNPDLLIMAHFHEEDLSGFPWEIFADKLTSLYRKSLLVQRKTIENSNSDVSIWKAFEGLDETYYNQTVSDFKDFAIDFSPLIRVIKEKSSNRFFWNAFFVDFKNDLHELLIPGYKVSSYGVQSLLVSIGRANLELEFQKLNTIIRDFEYWRYFEDQSIIISSEAKANLRAIAPSSHNFIRQVYTDMLSSSSVTTNNQSSETIWGENRI